jgi:hypothetical protein
MTLDTDMVRDQPDDAFAVCGGQHLAGIANPLAEPIEPKSAVRVQHHLDDGGVVEPGCDRRSQRRAQHPRAA